MKVHQGRGPRPQQAAQGQVREGAPHLLRGPGGVARGDAAARRSRRRRSCPRPTGPLPIVLSGGTAKPKGFKELFERTLKRAQPSRSRCPRCAWPPIRSPRPRAGRSSPRCTRSRPCRRPRPPGAPRCRPASSVRSGPLVAVLSSPAHRPGPRASGTTTTWRPETALIPDKRCARGIKNLRGGGRAASPPRRSNEQTYGLQFVDYLPTTTMGVCLPRAAATTSARSACFNIEEQAGSHPARRDAVSTSS